MIPSWALLLPLDSIKRAAEAHHLSPLLVAAIVMKESTGNPFKTRYEPKYKYFVDPPSHARRLNLSKDTEVIAQATSWGLMQIMGGTARERGFLGHMPELCVAAVGLDWGCNYLAHLLAREGDERKAVAAYNAGDDRDVAPKDGQVDNHEYVDAVFAFYDALKGKASRLA